MNRTYAVKLKKDGEKMVCNVMFPLKYLLQTYLRFILALFLRKSYQ